MNDLRKDLQKLARENREVRSLIRPILKKYRTIKAASLEMSRSEMDDLVSMQAETLGLDPGSVAATKEVKKAVKEYEKDLRKALKNWLKDRPLSGYKEGEEVEEQVEELMEEDGSYSVLLTLMGHGAGIWDGRWDDMFSSRKEIKDLSRYLERKLRKYIDSTGGGSINDALMDAAYETSAL